MILVTGATGTVGRELVAELLEQGRAVRALTRDPARARLDARVEVVRGDLERPQTLARAVEGVERVFSLALGPGLGAQEAQLARAAAEAGARHVVKLSVLGADSRAPRGVASWHAAGERALVESSLAWTFVRPGAFMANALYWADTIRRERRVYSNFGSGKLAPVHPRDIAAVAARALTADGHEGRAYSLTGPVALNLAEQVHILANVLARPIEYVPVDDEAARRGMQASGMPAYLIDALLPFAAVVRSGKAAEVHDTIERVLGRPALSFEVWAREHAAAFR